MNIFFIVLLGISIGSFLNVCIHRIPKKENIVWKPSYCPKCGHEISWWYKIPVLSYIFLKGKCGYCTNRISLLYPLVEIITAVLFLFLYWKYDLSLMLFKMSLLFCLLIVISFIDLKYMVIPNAIIVFGLVVGLIFNLFLYYDFFNYFLGAVIGGLSLLFVAFVGQLLFKRQSMGSGDIKLAAVIGFFIGWKGIILSLYLAIVLGAVFGGIGIISKQLGRFSKIPFGPFIALGTIIYIFFEPFLNFVF